MITAADVNRLETALATGHLTAEIEGERITYRSVAELKAALGYAKAELAGAGTTATGGGPAQSFGQFTRD